LKDDLKAKAEKDAALAAFKQSDAESKRVIAALEAETVSDEKALAEKRARAAALRKHLTDE